MGSSRNWSWMFLAAFVACALVQDNMPQIDRGEAKLAFEYLNKIRIRPNDYAQALFFNPYVVEPRPALKWNDTLALIAERKAMDMATRDYLEHVDPEGFGMNYWIDKGGYSIATPFLGDPRDNNFESLQGGATNGVQAIRSLIQDKGVPSLGHRYHVLGVGAWNGSLVDIGIGFVRTTGEAKYSTYTCVLIAKHTD